MKFKLDRYLACKAKGSYYGWPFPFFLAKYTNVDSTSKFATTRLYSTDMSALMPFGCLVHIVMHYLQQRSNGSKPTRYSLLQSV